MWSYYDFDVVSKIIRILANSQSSVMADGLFPTRQTRLTVWLVTEVTADAEAATIKIKRVGRADQQLTAGGRLRTEQKADWWKEELEVSQNISVIWAG